MRPIVFLLLSFAPVACSRRMESARPDSTQPALRSSSGNTAPAGFAVVELFTSEGCSSCPPADENLARIDGIAQRDATPVHVLSFHVDYWNYLGWRDPFSNPVFSLRQQHYAQVLGSSVYTPQLVVNGATQLSGSDESGADEAIQRALSRPATASITLAPKYDESKHALVLGYHVEHGPSDGVLTLCVVQSSGFVDVSAGENSGRKLAHRNVVRAYETRPVAALADGEWRTTLAPEIEIGRARVIAYVQDSNSSRIAGAQSSRL